MAQLIFYMLGNMFMHKRKDILGIYAAKDLEVSVLNVIIYLKVCDIQGMTTGFE